MQGKDWTPELAAFADLAVNASDSDALTEAFRAFARDRGISGFACGEVDIRDLRRTVMFAADWPSDWMDVYTDEALFENDPAIAILGRRSDVLSWDDVKAAIEQFGPVRRVMKAAESYGWRDGVFIPIARGGSRWGLATATGLSNKMSPRERSELSIALLLYYERLRGLLAGQLPVRSFIGLTRRELDCLAFAAHGADDQAIADKLSIAKTTVHFHIEKAKRRLNVRTRTEAVAIAISLGLVVI